jgi:hypothetical protein
MDANAIYFVDYYSKNLLKCTLSSGSVAPLITGNSSEAGPIFIDSNNVYADLNGNLLAVPKSGGAATTLVATGEAYGLASDGIHFFFVETNAIKSISVSGGPAAVIVTTPPSSLTGFAVDSSFLYWGEISGGFGAGKLWRMPKP